MLLFLMHFFLVIFSTILLCLPLYLFVVFKILSPGGAVRRFFSKIILYFSETWVSFNSFLIDNTAKLKLELDIKTDLNLDKNYLILANHQSWIDILLLQKIFRKRTPFLRFFLKKELFWLPFLGIAFWALDFPFMNRYSKEYLKKHPEKAGDDLKATQKTCKKLSKIPFSLINFPEGTRRTNKKAKNSKFKKLLAPKAGGIAFVLEALEGNIHHILDVDIIYSKDEVSIYDLLSGRLGKVKVVIHELKLPEYFGKRSYQKDKAYKAEFQQWVNSNWKAKDLRLSAESV